MITITVNLPDWEEVTEIEYNSNLENAFDQAKKAYPNWTSMVIVVTNVSKA